VILVRLQQIAQIGVDLVSGQTAVAPRADVKRLAGGDVSVVEDIDDRIRKRGAVDAHEVRSGDRDGVARDNDRCRDSVLRIALDRAAFQVHLAGVRRAGGCHERNVRNVVEGISVGGCAAERRRRRIRDDKRTRRAENDATLEKRRKFVHIRRVYHHRAVGDEIVAPDRPRGGIVRGRRIGAVDRA